MRRGPAVEALKILALAIAAAVVYGVLHDQITARVCVEYFTVGHQRVFGRTEDPTELALGWGVLATWWVGALLGLLLIAAARLGPWPKLTTRALFRPVAVLMLCMAALALAAGVLGYVLAGQGAVRLAGRLAEDVPPEKHAAFLADGFAHSASYLGGFVGGVVVCVRTVLRRRRLARQPQP
jgi:hypothetical protein